MGPFQAMKRRYDVRSSLDLASCYHINLGKLFIPSDLLFPRPKMEMEMVISTAYIFFFW